VVRYEDLDARYEETIVGFSQTLAARGESQRAS
jgi:hypothetical protein